MFYLLNSLIICPFLFFLVDFVSFLEALVHISVGVSSVVIADLSHNSSSVRGSKGGSSRTSWHTLRKSLAVTSRMLLCLIETNPLFLHDNACYSENLMPHSQNSGFLESCRLYQIRIRSQNNYLVRAFLLASVVGLLARQKSQFPDLNRWYAIIQNSCASG